MTLFNSNRYQPVTGVDDIDHPITISIDEYSYALQKMSWPYVDGCIDYPKIGYVNHRFATCECMFKKNAGLGLNNVFTGYLTRNDTMYMGYRAYNGDNPL